MTGKQLLRVVIFFVLLALVLWTVQNVVTGTDPRIAQWFGGFYAEPADSLDAVFIGSSATYAFWNAPYAWHKYGLTVFPLASPTQPFAAAEYLIREARKTQPNALYIVQFRSINNLSSVTLHRMTDYMPLSLNKLQMVDTLGDYMNLSLKQKAEYVFPVIRYHSRWTGLTEKDFYNPLDGYKGASYYASYLRTSSDITSSYRTTNLTGTLEEAEQQALEKLMAYCDQEKVNVLFVHSPQANSNEYELAQVNTIKETLEAHGYPVLNMITMVDEIGLDLKNDFYNAGHTNIYGSLKFTDYLSSYLLEHYDMKDKRGDAAYASWDKAYDTYSVDQALANVVPDVWDGQPRDHTLSAPKVTVSAEGRTVSVSWNAISGADGYSVYRRVVDDDHKPADDDLCWKKIATVAADEPLSCVDAGLTVLANYCYTVVPFRETDGVRYWGKYNYRGAKVQAKLDTVRLVSLEGEVNNLTLTWRAVEHADGYRIYRKLPGKTYILLKEIQDGTATTYVDNTMFENTPYIYTVWAYCLDTNGSKVRFSYDKGGILWVPPTDHLPQVNVTLTNGAPYLTWEPLEGIEGYEVYRRSADSEEWEQLNNLTADASSMQDTTAKNGVRYTYQVMAFVTGYSAGSLDGQEKETHLIELPCDQWVEATQLDTVHLRSLDGSENNMTLRWGAVKGADGYRVYRKVAGEKDWQAVTDLLGDTTSYTDTDMLPGVPYVYTVRAFAVAADGQSRMYGGYDAKGILWLPDIADLPQVSLTIVDGAPCLAWTTMQGMMGYEVYRRSSEDEDWQQVGKALSADTNQMKDTTAQAGTPYEYQVLAFVKGYAAGSLDGDAEETYSYELPCASWADAGHLDTPSLLSLDGQENSLTVRWSVVDGAVGYRLYRKLAGEEKWATLADITGAENVSYTDTDMQPGVPYTYTVRSFLYAPDGKTRVNSGYDRNGILWLPDIANLPQVTLSLADGVPSLSWEAVPGMMGYEVYRRSSEDEDWQQVGDALPADTCQMKDTTAKSGERYTYQVLAFVTGYAAGSLDGQAKETYHYELPCGQWITP